MKSRRSYASLVPLLRGLILLWGAEALGQIQQSCELSLSPNPTVGEELIFNLSCEDSLPRELAWEFGDGGELPYALNQYTASHVYDTVGSYNVFVRAQGETLPVSAFIVVGEAVQKIPVEHHSSIRYDSVSQMLWVVNPDNHSVSVIDPNAKSLLQEIPVGENPRSLFLSPDRVAYVVCQEAATVVSINMETYATHEELRFHPGSRPYAIVHDPTSDYYYVSLQGSGQLAKVERQTGMVEAVLEGLPHARGLALSPEDNRMLVTRYISPETEGQVTEVNLASFQVSRGFSLPMDLSADSESGGRGVPNALSHIIISPDGKKAYVTGKKDNVLRGLKRDGASINFENTVRTILCQLDLETGEENLSRRLDFNNQSLAGALALNSNGSLIFVATQASNQTNILFTGNLTPLGAVEPLSLTSTLAPSGLSLSSNGDKLFIDYFTSREVGVYHIADLLDSSRITQEAIIGKVTSEKFTPPILKGKQIFYNASDPRMSKDAYLSCAACHLEGGSDERVYDMTSQGEGFRNTTGLNGKGGMSHGPLHWSANFDEVQDFEHPIRNLFGGTGFITDDLFTAEGRDEPLGTPKSGASADLDALASYVTFLSQTRPSPYRNSDGNLTAPALRGKDIFYSAATQCTQCHSGKHFTDSKLSADVALLHDVGTLDSNSGTRLEGPLNGLDTPTLKGLWETAPYLHNGKAASLQEVLTVYNQNDEHGKTSALSENEINDLVQFLQQIDDSPDVLSPNSATQDRSTSSAYYDWRHDNNILQIRFTATRGLGAIQLVLRNLAGKMIWKEEFTPTLEGTIFRKSLTGLPVGVLVLEILGKGLKAREKWAHF